MAIRKHEQPQTVSIRDFWPRYRDRSIALLTLIQLTIAAVVIVALIFFGVIDPRDHVSLVAACTIALIILVSTLFTAKLILQPVRQITEALAYTAGEYTSRPSQDPDKSPKLKPLLEVIYGIDHTKPEASEDKPTFDINLPVGIALLDTSAKVVTRNHLVPTKNDDGNANSLALLFEPGDTIADWIEQCEQKAIKAERIWQRIPSHPLGDPERKIYDIAAHYEKGSDSPVTVVLMDKTASYSPEDEELNFIAFAAHELRGPITVINGYADTLNDELRDTLDHEQQQLFDRLIVSSNRLSGYINNILNSSKYDRRHLTVRLEEARLIDVYEIIAHDMELRASSQGRLLSIDIPATLPTVAADASSMTEVFTNLIDNAIKYSYEGGAVTVRAEQHGAWIEVEVTDRGIGMPGNVVKNLFHKFYRSHRSRETVAGTGIGLYISKAIVESHGGTMNVRSVEGEGSTFSFTLPTYASVAETLARDDGSNKTLIKHGGGWIKNHGTIRG